jgi:hypothetical protein
MTPVGAGVAVAYRRSSTSIGASYSSLSNNNLFYAGTANTPNYYIFHDGTNKDSTLGAYQLRVAPRDLYASTQDVAFMNTDGALPNFLEPDGSIVTKVESGAQAITGFTTDFFGNPRYGNGAYTGTGTAPDLGAIEKNMLGVPMVYVFDSSNVGQLTQAVLVGFANQPVLRIRVYAENLYTPLSATSFKLNTSGTTSIANISNAKIF